LLNACGFESGEWGWESLRQEAVRLESRVTEPQLLAFVRRVIQASAGRPGVESVCGLVASRPPANWLDGDAERFPDAARALGNRFRDTANADSGATTTSDGLDGLKPKERKRADRLLRSLRSHLAKSARQESARVIKAALAALLRDVDRNAE